MEIESKYLVHEIGAFSEALAANSLGPYTLDVLPTVRVQDTYLDTASSKLLRSEHVLRVRRQDGQAQATLKSLGGAEGGLHRRSELEMGVDPDVGVGRIGLPLGRLRERVEAIAGTEALVPILAMQQFRAPRVVFDGERLVAVLSLDVVAIETGVGPDVARQLEVELAGEGTEEDIFRLDPILRERGMIPDSFSKLERGLHVLQRNPDNPLLLLPHERRVLEQLAEAGTPLFRRRAHVVLLMEQGLNAATVANKVGLSALRVQHWLEAFRRNRMTIFEDATTDQRLTKSQRPGTRYAIFDLVSAGSGLATLYPPLGDEPGTDGVGLQDYGESDSLPGSSHPRRRAFDEEAWAVPARIVREESEEGWRESAEAPEPSPTGDGLLPPDSVTSAGFAPRRVAEGQPVHGGQAPLRKATPSDTGPTEKLPAPRSTLVVGKSAQAPSIVATAARVEIADAAALRRPVLRAADTVLSAAHDVLHYQYGWLADSAARAIQSEGRPRSVRRLLVAVHRLRIGLQFFQDYLPTRPVDRLHPHLRGLAQQLEVVGDLDHVIAHVSSAQRESNRLEAAHFQMAGGALRAQRAEAWRTARSLADEAAQEVWDARLKRLLGRLARQQEQHEVIDEFSPAEPDDYLGWEQPRRIRTQLHFMLGSAVWRQYESLRAPIATGDIGNPRGAHALCVACSAFQYLVSITRGCFAGSPSEVLAPLSRLESTLAMLTHAQLSAVALEEHDGLAAIAALRSRLAAAETDLLAEAGALAADVTTLDYRRTLADMIAVA